MLHNHKSGLSFSSPPLRSVRHPLRGQRDSHLGGRHLAERGGHGLDWYDVITKDGIACGTVTAGAYTDPTALLKGTWGRNQVATATVYSRRPTEKYYQEVEIRLRSALSRPRLHGL